MNATIEMLENMDIEQYFKEDKKVLEYQSKRSRYLDDLTECSKKLRDIVGN